LYIAIGFSSGWTNKFQLLYLTSALNFYSAAVRADGILIPNLHKALFVRRNENEVVGSEGGCQAAWQRRLQNKNEPFSLVAGYEVWLPM